jgi:hypothetical protein
VAVDVAAVLSQAWSEYLVSPEKWRIVENAGANIKSAGRRQVFLECLKQLRDVVAKHRSGAQVIPRPKLFFNHDRGHFHACDAEIPTIP